MKPVPYKGTYDPTSVSPLIGIRLRMHIFILSRDYSKPHNLLKDNHNYVGVEGGRGLMRPNSDRDGTIMARRSCAGPSLMQVQSYCSGTYERFYIRKMFNSHRRIGICTMA